MKPRERIATALWVLHTHIFEPFTISPRLAFTSPVRGCGKTTALAVLEQLVHQPERMDNATPAVIYHLIDRLHGSTLLVDEADNLGLNVNGILRDFRSRLSRRRCRRDLVVGHSRYFQSGSGRSHGQRRPDHSAA